MSNIVTANGLTGGTLGKLDYVNGDSVSDGDAAFVIDTSGGSYFYLLDASSGAAESSPDVIAPDTNPGDKRWILKAQCDTSDPSTFALLTSAQQWTKAQRYAVTTLTDEAIISWDMQAAPVAKVTLEGNRTLGAPSNIEAGGQYMLAVIQDTTGSRTLTWNSVFKWPGGTAPTLSTAANAVDVFSFVSFDGTNLYGVATQDMK